MKNTMFRCTVLGLSTLCLSLANAQSTATLMATVPFDFQVGEKAIPAGDCEIRTQVTPALVTVKCGTAPAMFALSNGAEETDRNAPARLIFHRYGDRYFLSQVWPGYGGAGSRLPDSARERELKTTARATTTTLILASR